MSCHAACRWFMAAALAAMTAEPALAQNALPDPARTPGALNHLVTQEAIGSTICVRGWTGTLRPPWHYTSALKRRQIHEWGYADEHMTSYEVDHLIPLSLGGAPDDPRNLWPEPLETAEGWTAEHKNKLEGVLNPLVCSGKMSLAEAQGAIAANWTAAYLRYVRQ